MIKGDREMSRHKDEARRENALFLMDTCGLDLEATARRLGMTPDALEKSLRKAGWTKEREQ